MDRDKEAEMEEFVASGLFSSVEEIKECLHIRKEMRKTSLLHHMLSEDMTQTDVVVSKLAATFYHLQCLADGTRNSIGVILGTGLKQYDLDASRPKENDRNS